MSDRNLCFNSNFVPFHCRCFYYLFISMQKDVPYTYCPVNEAFLDDNNKTVWRANSECIRATKTTYYYYKVALDATESLDDGGGLNWKLTLCLLLSWIIIFAITCKGVESMGKVRSPFTF